MTRNRKKERKRSKIGGLKNNLMTDKEVLEEKLNELGENRDFLKEMHQINTETDQKVGELMSNVAVTRIPFSGKGMFEQIMDELKSIRLEMREIDAKNEMKFEELKTEIKEIDKKSEEILEKIDENEEKLSEIQSEQKQQDIKMSNISSEVLSIRKNVIKNIRREILGEWKMVEHENFEGYQKFKTNSSFEWFSRNVKYSMENGLLKQTGGGYQDMKEGENKFGDKDLFVENNHVMTVTRNQTIDRYIEDGKLHVAAHQNGDVWKRVYEKI